MPSPPAVGHTGRVRTRPWLILALVAALTLSACSSTTVVSRDERAAGQDAQQGEPPTGSDADDSENADDADEADPASGDDTDTDDNDSDDSDSDDGEPDDGDSEDSADGDADDSDSEDDNSEGDDGDDESDEESDDDAFDLGDGEGFGLGGSAQLASLLADCQDGSDLACDVLFQISTFDSPEEEAAVTCGGRSDVEVTFCTEGVEALQDELVFDPDSDGIEAVVELCEDDGDMTACDFLYYRSPVDSELQEVGNTCGGRVSVATPDCRTLLADG